jgi:HEAT repeat protein
VQRNGARLLGRIAAAEAVPLLQPLLRRGEPRVARAAVSALGVIADPSAARAIHTILRSATGDTRSAVIAALVADRDARGRADAGAHRRRKRGARQGPRGRAGDADGTRRRRPRRRVAPIATAIQVRSFWRRGKARAIKERGISALAKIGGARAKAALDEAAQKGDRQLKTLAKAAHV